jgi:hypothetical protein
VETPRQQLNSLGVPTDALDAYELDIRREAAALLYDADSGTCGCGCHCAQLIDPDAPCPICRGNGGGKVGAACYQCGLVRTTEPPAQRDLIPSQLYEGLMAHLLGAQPLRPRPTYTGVLGYLEGGAQ